MTEKQNSKRNAQITLANNFFQWGDFIQCGATKILELFLGDILTDTSNGSIRRNRRLANRQGVYYWIGTLDNAESTKFYNVTTTTDPMSWYFNRDKDTKAHMEEMIKEAIDTVTNNLPDAEDLGAEPKETLEGHYDDFINDADTLTNDNNEQ